MSGMNRDSGLQLDGMEHIRQSVRDILTTPIGSRVMRREYGSQLTELIDQPLSGSTLLQAYAAAATALVRWEPRIRLSRLQFHQADMTGRVELELEATVIDGNKPLSLSIALGMGASA